VTLLKILTKKNYGPESVLATTGIFSPCLLRASARRKMNMLYKFYRFLLIMSKTTGF